MILVSCKTAQTTPKVDLTFKDEFDNLSKFNSIWENDSAHNSPKSYFLTNGYLKIISRPFTEDRVKIKTKNKLFGAGTYNWKIYVPQYELYEQCSIRAFIYNSKKGGSPFELDFEIGSGTKKHREELKALSDEAIVYCSSQFSPFESEGFKIRTEKWYTFKRELKDINNYYVAKWYINHTLVKTLKTKINSETLFLVHNSLENLKFMGDIETTKANYVLFDYFEFTKSKLKKTSFK